MAYTPPNVFVDGTAVSADPIQDNSDALRTYLHDGIVAGDLRASRFADTRHIQSPIVDPYVGLQHGVTGWQGGLDSGGPLTRATFITCFLTAGKTLDQQPEWQPLSGTAVRISVRKACTVLFHYRAELISGPDDSPAVTGRVATAAERVVAIAPYFSSPQFTQVESAQETRNNDGFNTAEFSPSTPYNDKGWGGKTGMILKSLAGPGEYTFGLAGWSQVDRVAVLNWAYSIEAFYV